MSSARRQAREAALQILYLWEVGRAEPGASIEAYFREHAPEAGDDLVEFATTLVRGTVRHLDDLDALIAQHSRHWRLDRLAIVDRLIIRMAAWEMQHDPETPAAVIINEALELTRRFSADEAVGFVNGMLDGIRKTIDAERSDASARN